MSLRKGTTVIAGNSQTEYIQQPNSGSVLVGPRGIVRSKTGEYFALLSQTPVSITTNDNFTDAAVWDSLTNESSTPAQLLAELNQASGSIDADLLGNGLQLGTTGTTALAGNTPLLQIGTTGTTALAGNTAIPDPAILRGLGTPSLGLDVTGVEIRNLIGAGTSNLVIGDTSTTALAGNTAIPSVSIYTGQTATGNYTIPVRDSGNTATKFLREDGDWVIPDGPDGGLTAVATDTSINGDGTTGSVLSVANPFTAADEAKLDGIAAGANNYVLPDNNVTNASVTGQTLTLTRQGSAADVTFTNTDTNTQLTSSNILPVLNGASGSIDADLLGNGLQIGTTSTTALAGNTRVISDANISAINANTLKVGFPGFGTTSTTALRGDTAIPTVSTYTGQTEAGNYTLPVRDSGNTSTKFLREDGDWVIPDTATGGLTAVNTDATINGDGTSGSALSVANPFTAADETKLDGIATGATNTDPAILRGGGTPTLGTGVTAAELRTLIGAGTSSTDTQLTEEQVQDFVGAMVSGNTETNISVTYDDDTGKLNFVATDTNTQLTSTTILGVLNGASGSIDADLLGNGLQLGTSSTTALAGNTTTISSAQATKLAGIAAGAEVNVTPDWDETSASSGAFIANKPTTITTAQSNAIVLNTAKTGITPGQAAAIVTNTAKDGVDAVYTGQTANGAYSVPVRDSGNTVTKFLREDGDWVVPSSSSGGDANVQANWTQTDTSADSFIQNKPDTITTAQGAAITANTAARVAQGSSFPTTGLTVGDLFWNTSSETITLPGENNAHTYRPGLYRYMGGQTAEFVWISAKDLEADEVDTGNIVDGAVGTSKIADDAVTNDKLANSVVSAIAANTAKAAITTAQSTKLAGIAAGAEVNVNADWDATTGDAFILNKPDHLDFVPAGTSFPASPTVGDYFWLTENSTLTTQNIPVFYNTGLYRYRGGDPNTVTFLWQSAKELRDREVRGVNISENTIVPGNLLSGNEAERRAFRNRIDAEARLIDFTQTRAWAVGDRTIFDDRLYENTTAVPANAGVQALLTVRSSISFPIATMVQEVDYLTGTGGVSFNPFTYTNVTSAADYVNRLMTSLGLTNTGGVLNAGNGLTYTFTRLAPNSFIVTSNRLQFLSNTPQVTSQILFDSGISQGNGAGMFGFTGSSAGANTTLEQSDGNIQLRNQNILFDPSDWKEISATRVKATWKVAQFVSAGASTITGVNTLITKRVIEGNNQTEDTWYGFIYNNRLEIWTTINQTAGTRLLVQNFTA